MARPSNIPEELVIPLFQEWNKGKTAAQLAEWLLINHNITVAPTNVGKRIKKYKDAELQARKDAIAEKASEQAIDYVSIMEQDIIKLNKKTNKLLESDKSDDLLLAKSLIETKLKLIDKQMDLTGMNEPDKIEQNQDFIIDGLINKLGKSN